MPRRSVYDQSDEPVEEPEPELEPAEEPEQPEPEQPEEDPQAAFAAGRMRWRDYVAAMEKAG